MENKKKAISEFYAKIFADENFKAKIMEKAQQISNEADLRKLIREKIVPLMKKHGVNFSEEELFEFEEDTLKKLSDENLANVSGGVSIKSTLLAGGALSMVLLGGVGLSASAMDDEPPAPPKQKQIIQTSSNEQRQNNNNTDNSQNSGNNANKGDVSKSGKSEEKSSVAESHEEGGANAVDSETVVPETAPPRQSDSEGNIPNANNDDKKEEIKKAFIKELLKRNVKLVSLYDKKEDGSFNDNDIAGEINTVLDKLKENDSFARVNWEQTKCDATTKCIKLATKYGEADVTFDDIRTFNLEKIRRAHARNLKRHLAGSWEAFKDQKFAGILSDEHSLLDPNKELAKYKVNVYNEMLKKNEEKWGLVQKLTVKTPFGESELQVSYSENKEILNEKDRLITQTGDCLSYDTIMKYFRQFSQDDQRKIRQAINDYLSEKVNDEDIEKLNRGITPLAVFNDKVKICEIEDKNEKYEELKKKKSAMSDFAAILMFCENSHIRINAGAKWERGATSPEGKSLNPNSPQGIDIFRKGFWLSTKTGTEIPKAVEFSRDAVHNTADSLDEIQARANQKYKKSDATFTYPPEVASVDVYKKSESLNDLELSDSSNGEEQKLEGTEHMVELKMQFGENVYKILKTVKCVNDINPGDLIKTKYKYLNPTVSNIDGEDIITPAEDTTSTAASAAEGADKK